MAEKVSLVDQVAKLKQSMTVLEEQYKQERMKNQAVLIRNEELEIELDRMEREIASLKSSSLNPKRVSWGSNTILEFTEPLATPPKPLSIHINKSHSRFDGVPDLEMLSQHCCNLTVRIPHCRSKSIPSTLQL